MRIVVTVDTEADGQWEHGRPLTTANVTALPAFHELCRRHGARPTYLVTSEIAVDPRAVSFLRPTALADEAEIGAHLHPWTTPPYADAAGLRENDPRHVYPCDLGPDLLRAKLETLTAQVTVVAGVPPRSYRAGRFGVDAAGAGVLTELGYEVDSSVTPCVSWAAHPGRPGGGGGPDFRRHTAHPFRIASTGTPGLIELPVTIMATYACTRLVPGLRDHWQAWPLRGARRMSGIWPRPQPLWLRPRPEYGLGDLQALLVEAERRRLPCVVLMFHSSELLPGASPYRATSEDVSALLALLDGLFAWARDRGHGFATLTEAGRALAAEGPLPVAEL